MFDIIKNFVMANLETIIIVAVFVIFMGILFKFKRSLFAKIALQLVKNAEAELGSGTGPDKFKLVADKLHSLIPKALQFLITDEDIENLIETAVEKMKKELEDEIK